MPLKLDVDMIYTYFKLLFQLLSCYKHTLKLWTRLSDNANTFQLITNSNYI